MMKCENCGNENVQIANPVRNTYICPKCGRDTESLFVIELFGKINSKAKNKYEIEYKKRS